jgi:hypothetical protein
VQSLTRRSGLISPLTALSSVLGWLRGVNGSAVVSLLLTRCMAPGQFGNQFAVDIAAIF